MAILKGFWKTFPYVSRRSKDEGDTIGVVIDADTDLDARWQVYPQSVLGVGYHLNVPQLPDPNGTILSPPDGSNYCQKQEFGLCPITRLPESWKTSFASSFRNRTPYSSMPLRAWTLVPEQRFTDLDRPKALIHTWLAWQKEPGKPYGTAITAKFLDPSQPQADILASWLKRLFL